MRRGYKRLLSPVLGMDSQAAILDIGCGAGFAVSALLSEGFLNARGIDATSGLVEIARGRSLPVDFVAEGQTESYLHARRQTLDAALLFEVLEHLEYGKQVGFLRSIRAAIRVGGVFLCQVPNAMCIASSYLRYNDWTHRCLFTMSSLEFVLESAGFEVMRIIGAPGRPSPVRSGLMRILMPAARGLLQGAVDTVWRVPVIASLGPLGFRHPVKPTLLAVCRVPSQ